MNYEQKSELQSIFYTWWAGIHDIKNEGKYANRADLAKLRRLDLVFWPEGSRPDVTGALSILSFQNLYRNVSTLLGGNLSERQEECLVIVAASLARIREETKNIKKEKQEDEKKFKKVAFLLGASDPKEALLSEARFRRLLRTETTADLFDQARRLCAILKKSAPINDLSLSLFTWLENPKVRRDWAMDYYHLKTTYQPSQQPIQS